MAEDKRHGKVAVEPEGYREEMVAFVKSVAPNAFERGLRAQMALSRSILGIELEPLPEIRKQRPAPENDLPACKSCGAPAGMDCRTCQGRVPPCYGREERNADPS